MTQPTILSAIDRTGGTPVYVQLRDIIKTAIRRNLIGQNDKIPSETVLAREYHISRMTVRHAVRELQREGWVYTKQGKGSYASRRNDTEILFKLDGFSTEMIKQGFTVHSRLLEVKKIAFSNQHAAVYAGLQEDKEKPLIAVRRIRFVEGKPCSLEHSFLPLSIGKGLLSLDLGGQFSIYRYLEKELGMKLSWAERMVEPKVIHRDDAELLGVKRGTPVLFISGTTFSASGKPVEFINGIYLANRYKLRMNIQR